MTLPFSVGTGDREFLFARYVDWSLTTPILLLGLTMTALHGAHRRAGLVAGLLASDVVMIVTGLFYGMSVDPFAKWMWFITSCVAFLAVYYILFGAMRKEAMARDSERRSAYTRNVLILSALWLLYPDLRISRSGRDLRVVSYLHHGRDRHPRSDVEGRLRLHRHGGHQEDHRRRSGTR